MTEVNVHDVDLAVNNLRCNDCVVHKKLTVKNLEIESLKFVTTNAQQGDLLTLGEDGKIEFGDGASGGGAGALENVEDPLTGDGTIGNPLTLSTSGATENSVLTFNGTAWAIGTQLTQGVVPDLFLNNYNQDNLAAYLNYLTTTYSEPDIHVLSFNAGITFVSGAYEGGVYSPYQNRIYFVPRGQSNQTDWHYVDCNTGTLAAYTHGATVVVDGYSGGCYHPPTDRIYFAPWKQGDEANWHYIDCSDGSVVAYARAGDAGIEYSGAVYSPNEQKIYFIPNFPDLTPAANLARITPTGVTETYAVGVSTTNATYYGGTYCPTLDRIYPAFYGDKSATWHYIDCATGTWTAYSHGIDFADLADNPYISSAYHPILNRIYLGPSLQVLRPIWHYIDCSDGSVVGYANPTSLTADLYPTFSPVTGRLYMVSSLNSLNVTYIDETGAVVTETGVANLSSGKAAGGVYSPTENRIYPALRYNTGTENWWYIEELNTANVSVSLMGGPLFNKSF